MTQIRRSATPALAQSLTPEEARAITKEATIYGVPMLENYAFFTRIS
jgi:hypothetical protein